MAWGWRSSGRRQARALVAHSGSTGGYKTWLARYPGTGVSVAVMCNNGGINPIALGEDLAVRALAAEGRPTADPVAAAPVRAAVSGVDLAPYQGLFRNPVTGELVRTTLTEGRLTLTQGQARELTPLGRDGFQRADGGGARFVMGAQGPAELILSQATSQTRYVAVPPPSADPATLGAYVGTYYSAELETRITVVRQGDTLVMRQAFGVEWPLTPRFADGFSTPLRGVTTFVFTRSADGRITGFRAWANGARNIEFARE
jgi:hypothetical protein